MMKCHSVLGRVLLCLAIAVLSACAVQGQDRIEPRPNIVFILLDDVRWDDLHSFAFVHSPNIDRIAAEGASFRNFFVTTPLCSPSRASFLTGQYASAHRILDNRERAAQSHELQTFPLYFQNAGYRTAFVGKWHMGHEDDSRRPGFHSWISFEGQGEYFDPIMNVNGKRVQESGYMTDILNRHAADFIREGGEQESDQPFLLFVSHKAVHPEIHPHMVRTFPAAPRHEGLYEGQRVPRSLAAQVGTQGKQALERSLEYDDPRSEPMSDNDILNRLRMLSAVDDGIGEIVRLLEETQELDQTIVVVTSDQGFFYGEFGLGQERRLAYDPSIRIPFLIRYPPLIQAGARPDATGLNIDMAPTLLELGGISAPSQMQGRSLVDVLQNGNATDTEPRDRFLIEYYTDEVFPRIRNMGYKAIRTGRYKYIRYSELPGMDELYDLEADPHETGNLARDPNSRAVRNLMRRRLGRLIEETSAIDGNSTNR